MIEHRRAICDTFCSDVMAINTHHAFIQIKASVEVSCSVAHIDLNSLLTDVAATEENICFDTICNNVTTYFTLKHFHHSLLLCNSNTFDFDIISQFKATSLPRKTFYFCQTIQQSV